jgi:hypothetical protein
VISYLNSESLAHALAIHVDISAFVILHAMATRPYDWSTGRRHPTYWLEDGSLLICVEEVLFKVHKTLLHRHSHVLNLWTSTMPESSDVDITFIPDVIGVLVEDFVALLEHLYHDV